MSACSSHTSAESGAYLRDSSRVPRRRPLNYFKPPYVVGSVPSLSGHAIAYRWRSLPRVRRHRAICCYCCFSHSAYWLPTRKKLLYTVANPARGLLNREKRTKEKVWQHTPPPPPLSHTAHSEKINEITRRIYRRYAGLGRSRVRTRIPSARRLGQWVWLRKILHSRLR